MRLAALSLLAVAVFPQSRTAGDDLTPARFEALKVMIRPGPGSFEEIPWVPTLWEARRKAAAEGKPMFVVSGGGHPFGAT